MWIEASGDVLINREQITWMGVEESGGSWHVDVHIDTSFTSPGRRVASNYPTEAEALAAMNVIAAGLPAPEPSS